MFGDGLVEFGNASRCSTHDAGDLQRRRQRICIHPEGRTPGWVCNREGEG